MYENMQFGRYCKSGMAHISEADNKMICVEIGNVKTNVDGYSTDQESPFECRIHNGEEEVVDDFSEACKYYYKDSTGAE